ncbi:hypothetical protein HanXRQr2_Chr17g0831581 [Helianthus annuus]|uniref:Uncharacterized protein n=1 Tax=Helianthus annuus TaxID=4232 RepID=A0A9K3DPE3_HELAN|nr:hypothetical protein HanXRQr2_Chr17g0831581 [Helianthus annuus]
MKIVQSKKVTLKHIRSIHPYRNQASHSTHAPLVASSSSSSSRTSYSVALALALALASSSSSSLLSVLLK